MSMQAVKAIQFQHGSKQMLPILETFRHMVNEAMNQLKDGELMGEQGNSYLLLKVGK